ncbi:MAG: hypothetical protein ACREBR_00625 [bacterium]
MSFFFYIFDDTMVLTDNLRDNGDPPADIGWIFDNILQLDDDVQFRCASHGVASCPDLAFLPPDLLDKEQFDDMSVVEKERFKEVIRFVRKGHVITKKTTIQTIINQSTENATKKKRKAISDDSTEKDNSSDDDLKPSLHTKFDTEKLDRFSGAQEAWDNWLMMINAQLGSAGFSKVLTTKDYAINHKKENKRLYHLLMRATIEGSAHHLINEYVNTHDGYSAYHNMVRFYEGDQSRLNLARARTEWEKLKLFPGGDLNTYINNFKTISQRVIKHSENPPDEPMLIQRFMNGIEDDDYETEKKIFDNKPIDERRKLDAAILTIKQGELKRLHYHNARKTRRMKGTDPDDISDFKKSKARKFKRREDDSRSKLPSLPKEFWLELPAELKTKWRKINSLNDPVKSRKNRRVQANKSESNATIESNSRERRAMSKSNDDDLDDKKPGYDSDDGKEAIKNRRVISFAHADTGEVNVPGNSSSEEEEETSKKPTPLKSALKKSKKSRRTTVKIRRTRYGPPRPG